MGTPRLEKLPYRDYAKCWNPSTFGWVLGSGGMGFKVGFRFEGLGGSGFRVWVLELKNGSYSGPMYYEHK